MEKELRKLSRRELVDVIFQMKKNEQLLQEEISSLKNALEDKRIKISEAGSIAEAATDISQVFSAAQTTAELYLNEIACMKAEAEKECAEMLDESRKKVFEILSNGEKDLALLKETYKAEYQKYKKLKEKLEALEQKEKQSCED